MYEELSQERKELQEKGLLPEWFTTAGWQLFKAKYMHQDEAFYGQAKVIAEAAAKHMGKYKEEYEEKFFNLIWNGWLSCSTPILANMGTDRGLPVSCAGNYTEDSVGSFYDSLKENAVLTQNGFGTSSYLGDIRPRGSKISKGGVASGVMPVIEDLKIMSQKVSQGSQRRGAIASYLPIDHGDFYEVVDTLKNNPDDLNIGWIITDEFVARLEDGCEEAEGRFKRALYTKMITGKGYFFFVDKVNRHRPEAYVNNGLYVKASQLCNEINLFSDKEHTYTCVLASMNLSKYDEWKNTDAVQIATIFLDCVVSEFLDKAQHIDGLEKAVRSTEKGRALGLGTCGWHTYLMDNSIPVESLEAHMWNTKVFKDIADNAKEASVWLSKEFGEPEWCNGLGVRNTHLTAPAPTKSTAIIMAGISEGINPQPAMVYTQNSAAGDIARIDPSLLKVMKEKGVYNKQTIQSIIDTKGSVQHVDWLSTEEKKVFKTGFEIDQSILLRLASVRGKDIDQWQSLNLFFSAEESPQKIAKIHREAFLDEGIRGLYYCYSKSGVQASKDLGCEACQ